MKCYWPTATSACLRIVYDCCVLQKAEVSSCDRGHVAYSACDVYYPAFHRKSWPILVQKIILLVASNPSVTFHCFQGNV